MKAITIQQPWATLIALGEKRFETRSRRTNIRGPIAIHAGKSIDMEALLVPEIKQALLKHGYNDWTKLPFGAVIAIAELVESWKYDATHELLVRDSVKGDIRNDWDVCNVEENEYKFGYFDVGRHAWEMAKIKQIDPVPAKGQQGWWNWDSAR